MQAYDVIETNDLFFGVAPFYFYLTHYLIDLRAQIITDVEAATPAYRTQEIDSTKTMIDRGERRFDMRPRRSLGVTEGI